MMLKDIKGLAREQASTFVRAIELNSASPGLRKNARKATWIGSSS